MWDSGWDDIFQKHEWGRYPCEEVVRYVARTTRGLEDRAGFKVLEVGCGTGANLWYIAREGFAAFGIDGSAVAVARAEKRLHEEGLSARLQVGDAMRLPYEDGFFDLVLDVECIYANSMKDSRVILSEIERVLKLGGHFFSKTFMTGTYGDGKGRTLPGEPNSPALRDGRAAGGSHHRSQRATGGRRAAPRRSRGAR